MFKLNSKRRGDDGLLVIIGNKLGKFFGNFFESIFGILDIMQ